MKLHAGISGTKFDSMQGAVFHGIATSLLLVLQVR